MLILLSLQYNEKHKIAGWECIYNENYTKGNPKTQ